MVEHHVSKRIPPESHSSLNLNVVQLNCRQTGVYTGVLVGGRKKERRGTNGGGRCRDPFINVSLPSSRSIVLCGSY